MEQDVLHPEGHKPLATHRKPRHIAEKLESYLGIGIAVMGLVLLGFLLVGFMQTGTGAPSWMR